MDWFEKKVGFHGDPKCLALRAKLGNKLAECYVDRIYCYCYLQEVDRFARDVAPAVLEKAAEWSGKTGHLIAALLACGFLDDDGAEIVVHGVAQRLAKARVFRQGAAERQQRARDRRNGQPNGEVTRDVTGPVTRDSRVSHGVPTDRPTDRPTEQIAALRPTAPEVSERWPLGEQFRRLMSQGLGGMQNGGKGLAPLDAAAERDALEADLRAVGVDAAAAACLEKARRAGKGRISSLAYFSGMTHDLAQPPAASIARVTAPASSPAKFAKGGPVAL